MAERDIVRAKELDRCSDALVHATALKLSIGKGLHDLARSSLAALGSSNDPLNYRAHLSALTYFCAKWHGSHQQMFAFARSVVQQLHVGHPLWVLIPKAHFERQLIVPQRGYWRQASVRQEIMNAYLQAFGTNVGRATEPWELELEMINRNFLRTAYCSLDAPTKSASISISLANNLSSRTRGRV